MSIDATQRIMLGTCKSTYNRLNVVRPFYRIDNKKMKHEPNSISKLVKMIAQSNHIRRQVVISPCTSRPDN